MNLSFVAADVRRRRARRITRIRLLTSAATFLGFKVRIFQGILTLQDLARVWRIFYNDAKYRHARMRIVFAVASVILGIE